MFVYYCEIFNSFKFHPKKAFGSFMCFVHITTSLNSSSYCAHDNQFRKGLRYNVSQVKFNFVMFVSNAFAYV